MTPIPTPPAMSVVSPSDDVRVWILGAAIVFFLLPMLAFFLSREFRQKDRFSVAVEELNKAVNGLRQAIDEIKLWSVDRFVSHETHEKAIGELKQSIKELQNSGANETMSSLREPWRSQ